MLPVCLVLLGKISLFLVDYTYNHDRLKAFGHEICHEHAAREKKTCFNYVQACTYSPQKNTFNPHVQNTKKISDI